MADMSRDQLINALNYLGTNVSIPITGSGLPASAAAAGAIPAPASGPAGGITASSAPGTSGPVGGEGITGTTGTAGGGGLNPFGAAGQIKNVTDLAQQLFGGGQTRGDTGDVSLSDQVRSSGIPTSAAVPGLGGAATLPVGGGETILPGAIPGTGLSGETAGGLSFNFGPGAGGGAATPALDTGVSGLTDLISNSLGGAGSGIAGGVEGASSAAALEALSASAADAGGGLSGGLAMGIIGAIPGLWEGINNYMQSIAHRQAQLQETKGIRENMATAWGPLANSGNALAQLQGIDALPREQQIPALQSILQQANQALTSTPAVSQYISTQGGRQDFIPGVDVSGFEQYSGDLSRDAVLAYTMAADKLTQLGVPPDIGPGQGQLNISDFWQTPDYMIGRLGLDTSGLGGVDLGGPGQRTQGLINLYSQFNPSFGQSGLGQFMQAFMTPQAAATAPTPAAPAPAPAPATVAPTPDTGALTSPGGTAEEERLRRQLEQ